MTYEELTVVLRTSLPAAAQRWLDKVLPEEQDQQASVILEQEGTMEIRGRWVPFKASGVYQASPLSFNWRAKLSMLPGVWIEAEDGQKDNRGWGGARLWGLIPMGTRTDREVLKSQLVRNLAELAWLPSFALANPLLQWTDSGESSFEVQSEVGGQVASVRFEIDKEGDIIRAYSLSRPYDVPDGYAEAPWFYQFSDHREFSVGRIPAVAAATFEKSDGPWEYFRGRITAVKLAAT